MSTLVRTISLGGCRAQGVEGNRFPLSTRIKFSVRLLLDVRAPRLKPVFENSVDRNTSSSTVCFFVYMLRVAAVAATAVATAASKGTGEDTVVA